MNATLRRGLLGAMGLLLLTATLLEARMVQRHRESVARGQVLFEGADALVGRITGQSEALPIVASRCGNCHEPQSNPDGAQTPAFADRLDRASLTTMRVRRGGPASLYGARSFCALVRSGIDPAYIIIPQAMPRYAVSDDDCRALWDYVTSR